ncbi:uncharacterized protein ACNS7B_018660 isoform 2-T2 [Menidia menidia]
MTCEEEPEICTLRARQLLSEAQLLMRDIEKMLGRFPTKDTSKIKSCGKIPEESQASTEEEGEILIIDGFSFESAASREGLWRLSSQVGAGSRRSGT